MGFEPIHGVHAVETVAFTVRQDRPINISILQQSAVRKLWETELPAKQIPQLLETEMGPAGAVQKPVVSGLEFANLRQNGSPAWLLRFLGTDIVVECTRYTDWEKVSNRALRYIREALSALITADSNLKLSVIAMNVVDRFRYKGGDADYRSLLKAGSFLAVGPASKSPLWHQHSGWFEFWNGIPVLNQLNIDVQGTAGDSVVATLPDDASVRIQHLQEMRFVPQSASEFLRDTSGSIEATFSAYHIENLRLMSKLLSLDAAKNVGLYQSSEENS
ncbi:MAG: hypothetical protein ACK5S0_01070 [bacterium]|jgi:uncharacterized protein (TIGR04255 family)|nr:hypothetical protein [Roseomonas sp.]